MAEPLIMPKLDMTMQEGTLGRWYKQEGDVVTKGDVLFEVEADKVNIDIESPADGVLQGVAHPAGTRLPIGAVLGWVVAPGESWSPAEDVATTTPASVARALDFAPIDPAPATGDAGGPATPAAKRLARELGVDLGLVTGTGPDGLITTADVKATERPPLRATSVARKAASELGIALESVQGSGPDQRVTWADVQQAADSAPVIVAAPAPFAAATGIRRIPLQGIRAVIARRLQESYLSSPHVSLNLEADMAAIVQLRTRLGSLLEKQGIKLSLNSLIAFMVTKALIRFPAANATWEGSDVLQHEAVNLGIAVDTPTGLMVPVVHGAQALRLVDLSVRIAALAQKAREGKLLPGEMTGGTFTISNLGTLGIESFTSIINPPQVAILGVGALVEKVVPHEGQAVIRPRLNLAVTLDHRVLDGADGARFLAYLKGLLEAPERLLL